MLLVGINALPKILSSLEILSRFIGLKAEKTKSVESWKGFFIVFFIAGEIQ